MVTKAHAQLSPCPFCGGAVMFRKALFVSDGCTDAIIHAEPTNCGMTDFTTYTTDESVIAAWNTRTQLRTAAAEGGEAAGYVQPEELQRLATTGEEMIYRDRMQDDFIPVYLHPPTDSGAGWDGERWLPIDTAPMDGTEILGYRNGKIAKAYRVQRDDCEMWSFGGRSGSIQYCPDVKPTHWRQIPDPPVEDTAIVGVAGEG